MSPLRASGGASALKGSWAIITSADRACSRSSATAMAQSPRVSVIGVLEGRLAVLVEGADPLDAIGMHGRAPVRLHHDRDRLFDRLPLAHAYGPLDRLDC